MHILYVYILLHSADCVVYDIEHVIYNSNGEENIIDVINASKTRDEDVFKLLVGFSATLISGFISPSILSRLSEA